MSRSGYPGTTLTLSLNFYENGVLFDPFSISNVNIYDSSVGGTLITTLAVQKTSTGMYFVEWEVPDNQTIGTYYDEWSWIAVNGMSTRIERHDFTLEKVYTSFTSQSGTITNRLRLLEIAVNRIQTALNNLATRKEMKNLFALLTEEISSVREDMEQLELTGSGSALQNHIDDPDAHE